MGLCPLAALARLWAHPRFSGHARQVSGNVNAKLCNPPSNPRLTPGQTLPCAWDTRQLPLPAPWTCHVFYLSWWLYVVAIQSLGHVWLFATPLTAARLVGAIISITSSLQMGKLRHRKGKQLIWGFLAQKVAELGFEPRISLPHPSPQCVLASKPGREPVLRRRGAWLFQEREHNPSSPIISPFRGQRNGGGAHKPLWFHQQSTTMYGIIATITVAWSGKETTRCHQAPWRGVSVM